MGFGRVSGVIELRWYLGICSLALREKQGREGGGKGRIAPNNEKEGRIAKSGKRLEVDWQLLIGPSCGTQSPFFFFLGCPLLDCLAAFLLAIYVLMAFKLQVSRHFRLS